MLWYNRSMRVTADKIIPQEHLPVLERVCQNTKDKELFLHAQALLLRSQGKTLKQIKEALGVPESTVKFYTKRLKQEGIAGLSYHGQSGNRNLLTIEQELKLRELLSKSEAWYPEQIKWYILVEFGVKYADNSHSIAHLMERMGFVRDIRTGEVFITPEAQKLLPPIKEYYDLSPQQLKFLEWTEKRYGWEFSRSLLPTPRGRPKRT